MQISQLVVNRFGWFKCPSVCLVEFYNVALQSDRGKRTHPHTHIIDFSFFPQKCCVDFGFLKNYLRIASCVGPISENIKIIPLRHFAARGPKFHYLYSLHYTFYRLGLFYKKFLLTISLAHYSIKIFKIPKVVQNIQNRNFDLSILLCTHFST